jgi:hypothetical protein
MEEDFNIGDFSLDLDDFNVDDENIAPVNKNPDVKQIRDRKAYFKFLDLQLRRIKEIDELITLPKNNEQIRIITEKALNTYAILRYILQFGNIEECYITTFNVDSKSIRGLRELVDEKKVLKLTILVSAFVNHSMQKRTAELKSMSGNGISIIYAWNHTKILLCKTEENHYIVEGSGNLSASARIEQYLFEESEKMYEFHKGWIEDVESFCGKEVERIT